MNSKPITNDKPIHLKISNYTRATIANPPQELKAVLRQCPGYVFDADYAVLGVDSQTGQLIGAAIANKRDDEILHIEWVEVADGYRGRRMASAFIDYVIRHAKGFKQVTAEVDGCGYAHKLITSSGFKKTSKVQIGAKFSDRLPIYVKTVDETAIETLDEETSETVLIKKKGTLNVNQSGLREDVLHK